LLGPGQCALGRRSHDRDQQDVLAAPERVQLHALWERIPERVVADPAELLDLLAPGAAALDARPLAIPELVEVLRNAVLRVLTHLEVGRRPLGRLPMLAVQAAHSIHA